MYNKKNEKKMKAAFKEQATMVLKEPERFEKKPKLKIGFESEVGLYREELKQRETEKIRDQIVRETFGIADVELGAMQVEIRTPAVEIASSDDFKKLTDLYTLYHTQIQYAAHRKKCSILRIGANPYVSVADPERTNRPKYLEVPDFYNARRRKGVETKIGISGNTIDVGNAAVVSLFQAFHINMEAYSFADAVSKMNQSLSWGPYLLALAGNARYLSGTDTKMEDMRYIDWEITRDTGFNDLRMLAWERNFDNRTPRQIKNGYGLRVGLPERYFNDLDDYLKRTGSFPFIFQTNPEAALQTAIGMHWLDTRIKIDPEQDALIVEFRLLSTLPSVETEMALALFYLGRLAYANTNIAELLPISYVRENRLSAMAAGRNSDMWFMINGRCLKLPFRNGIVRELRKAKKGLMKLELLPAFDEGVIYDFIENGSPSERLAEKLKRKKIVPKQEMIEAMKSLGMLI